MRSVIDSLFKYESNAFTESPTLKVICLTISALIMAREENKRYPELDCYLNEEFSNVWFVIDGQRLPANKELLTIKSHVFRAQFSGNFVDSGQKEITITDTTVDGFKVMLRFLYTEELILNDPKNVQLCLDVYNLSHKYQLDRLKDLTEGYIEDVISGHNFADIYAFAFDRNFEDLMKIAKHCMENSFDIWSDLDIKKFIEMNVKTNNSLTEILVQKYRQLKNSFQSPHYNPTSPAYVPLDLNEW